MTRRRPESPTFIAAALAAALAPGIGTAAAAPNAVASIKPVHALVAGVMTGVGEPGLIVEGAASPHTYQLRPSEARVLSEADLVFYVGDELEGFLAKPLQALSPDARVVALLDADGIETLAFGGGDGHGHGDEHEHAGARDPHAWLDPDNARAMADAIAAELAAADPANAAAYRANAVALKARIDDLDAELQAALAPVRDAPFVTFHDAYRYLAGHYGLNALGAIALDPERQPGARHLGEIRAAIEAADARCVFAEPQFEPKLVATVTEGTGARTAVLDPLGAELEPGPDAWFELMRANAEALVRCLGSDDG